MDKFEHGFGTQLGAVLLWRRVRSGGVMLAAWSHQTSSSSRQQAAVGSSRQSQSHAACTYKGKQQAGSSSNMMFRSPGPACL